MGDELDRKIDRINNQRKALYSQIPGSLPKQVIKKEKIKKLTDILKEISDVIQNLLRNLPQLENYQDLLPETEKIIKEDIETSQMLGSIEKIEEIGIDDMTEKLQKLLDNLKSYQRPIADESTSLLS
jgi:hypothetical protein